MSQVLSCLVTDSYKQSNKMSQIKVYMSNLSPLWTVEKQKALLPLGVLYEDAIKPHKRRSAHAGMLTERAEMLRPSTRTEAVNVYVAALPVLAFDAEDFMLVLKQAAARNATVHICDKKLTFPPNKQAAILHKAAKLFKEAKSETSLFERGQLGGMASAGKKKADSQKKANVITKEMWGDPKVTNAMLCEMSGLSIDTLRRIFEAWGTREDAIKRMKAVQKRKAKRGNNQIIEGLKAAVDYANGDESKGTKIKYRAKNGVSMRIVK